MSIYKDIKLVRSIFKDFDKAGEAFERIVKELKDLQVEAKVPGAVLTDLLGKTCQVCRKGTYQETSLHEDWEGKLHCNKCNHEVIRYSNCTNRKS